ncbi:MAG TPA: GDSL-type esterase/lipase family protein [Acidobacteriota bacterium]|nr:GDSL-type esterase/lipase family protein [Acidobacteriota bacterium]
MSPSVLFQHMLEAKLNDQLPGRYEIINLGISGQNTRHGLGTLRHYALPLEPDLLVISYGANDPRLVPVPTDELLAPDDTWAGTLRFTMLKLRTYRLLRRLFFTFRNPLAVDREEIAAAPARVPAVSVDEYRENLIEMIQTARQAGARPLLLSVCTRNKVYVANINNVPKWTNTPIVNARELFIDSLDALADGDLHPEKVRHYRSMYGRRALRTQRLWYVTSDGCHPNWVGHTLIADEMFPLVKRILDTPLEADRPLP